MDELNEAWKQAFLQKIDQKLLLDQHAIVTLKLVLEGATNILDGKARKRIRAKYILNDGVLYDKRSGGTKEVVNKENVFEKARAVHVSLGHAGGNKTWEQIHLSLYE